MDPGASRPSSRSWRLPRASGDGPLRLAAGGRAGVAAPRERGWTPAVAVGLGRGPGCPARAGMDPGRQAPARRRSRLPRASGDGPETAGRLHLGDVAAPRERGWTLAAEMRGGGGDGCPARAGMDPKLPACFLVAIGLPRASGDGPTGWSRPWLPAWAAPRERGWTPEGEGGQPLGAGCPARAGMDPATWVRSPRWCRLPRASGDGPRRLPSPRGRLEAAPRERGWTRMRRVFHQHVYGCPARAGERGWTPQRCAACSSWEGCPARAGMDPKSSTSRPTRTRLPRASRERGWTPRALADAAHAGGCPARAGMDPRGSPMSFSRPRLPRASGDGPAELCSGHALDAAAPRERGWTPAWPAFRCRAAGCPARAGMDPAPDPQ